MTTRSRRSTVTVLLACIVLGLAAGPAAGVAPEDSWAYDLAGDVMSPYCPGRTLASCPSPQAAELIQWIALQEAAGASREEVEAQLYARFGDVIRAAPKPEGWGLAAYAIPLLSALVGIGLVAWVLRRLSAGGDKVTPAPVPTGSGPSDDEIERLVDRELEQI
jgi:cytochrome c-type biogenesis protein CcmH/NrfF